MSVRNTWTRGIGGLVGVLALCLAGMAAAQDIDQLITQVGQEYARAYSSPFLYTYGPNINSNMFSTAKIPWNKPVFGIGVKFMATKLDAADQTFSKVIPDVDLSAYDSNLPPGTTGDVYMSGPTIFGSTGTDGHVQGFVNGVEVFNYATIPGLVDTRWSPLFAPEVYFGGIVGLKATVRYLPEMDAGDLGKTKLGKTKYWGFGLQWSANGIVPSLPVDVMAGFFTQELDLGSAYESKAHTIFVAASRSFQMLTIYGGLAAEDSSMKVAYDYEDANDPSLNTHVSFKLDGEQSTRLTIGATLDALAKLNVEAGMGNKMTTWSAGFMFGL